MIKKRLGFLIISLLLGVVISMAAMTGIARTEPLTSSSHYPEWRATNSNEDCIGPIDENENPWYHPDFDDSSWDPVSLPMVNDINGGEDRYYRTTYIPPVGVDIYLNLASDDGVWVYINGNSVGHWGGGCHLQGCVGDLPWSCYDQIQWTPLDITPYLTPGTDNVIAVHVTNEALANSLSYFNLSIHPEGLFLDLPFAYPNRDTSNRYGFYRDLELQLEGSYDHTPAGDNDILTFIGQEVFSPESGSCGVGVDCYDDVPAWTFTSEGWGEPVYPAASGVIVEAKSGCNFGDDYGCRVCIAHGNSGYSTLYYNLSSSNLVVSGAVTKGTQIGRMNEITPGTFLFKADFAIFYDPASSCQTGKEVDPSGWAFPANIDPHETATGLKSQPLWVHPFSISTTLYPSDPRYMPWAALFTEVNFVAGTYGENLNLTLAPAPDPKPTSLLEGGGRNYYFVGVDSAGNVVSQVSQPMEIISYYDITRFTDVFTDSLKIYQYNHQTQDWQALQTTLTPISATATTQTIAPFALLGEKQYNIEFTIVGQGSVVTTPEGPFHYGSEVQLKAQPEAGWVFSEWDGDLTGNTNPVTLTIQDNLAITVIFIDVPEPVYLPIILVEP